jgi:hypothetical protein
MPDYRAYVVGIDGHFVRVEFLHSHPDDAAAIEPNNSLTPTTLSYGTATGSWVGTRRKRSKAASVGKLRLLSPLLTTSPAAPLLSW